MGENFILHFQYDRQLHIIHNLNLWKFHNISPEKLSRICFQLTCFISEMDINPSSQFVKTKDKCNLLQNLQYT